MKKWNLIRLTNNELRCYSFKAWESAPAHSDQEELDDATSNEERVMFEVDAKCQEFPGTKIDHFIYENSNHREYATHIMRDMLKSIYWQPFANGARVTPLSDEGRRKNHLVFILDFQRCTFHHYQYKEGSAFGEKCNAKTEAALKLNKSLVVKRLESGSTNNLEYKRKDICRALCDLGFQVDTEITYL